MTNLEPIPCFEYGSFWDNRKECFQKFGEIFKLPIIDNPYAVINTNYSKGNILDIGAGREKPVFHYMNKKIVSGKYYSLDTDNTANFDFRSIDEVPANLRFSLMFANQLFEHLDIQESIDLMFKASCFLEVGGKFIITIPNISHPNRFFADITHKTYWSYNSFYTVFRYANLEVTKIARYSKRHPQGFIEKTVAKYISQIYRMDWCDSILMIGEKNG